MTSFYFTSRAKPRMTASNGGLKTIPESHEGDLVEVSSHSKAFKLSQPIQVMRLLDRKCSLRVLMVSSLLTVLVKYKEHSGQVFV